MLVAISGAQGSGKTTVLNELGKLGFNIIERKTARSVMTEQFQGKTLDDLYADPVLTAQWQTAILERKCADETFAIYSKDLWFTERTFADLFTYAVMAIGKNNAWSEWLDEYYQRCWDNNKLYLGTFYLTSGHFNPVPDGVRGINKHYQAMIDQTLQRVSMQTITELVFVKSKNIEERIAQILEDTQDIRDDKTP